MLETLLTVLVFAPQEPLSEAVRAVHREIGAAATVEDLESARRAPRARIASVRPPAGLAALRAEGVAAVDAAESLTRLEDAQLGPAAFALLRRLSAFEAAPRPAPAPKDVGAFEDLLEHAFRDVRRALGSGRELERMAPRLQDALDEVCGALHGTEPLGQEVHARLEAGLERVAAVDHALLVATAERIVLAALTLGRPEVVDDLRRRAPRSARSDQGVEGEVLIDRDTAFGRLVVGGFGRNVYDCSRIDVIVDPGGDDEYRGPAGGASGLRRLAVVVDLSGDDVYTAVNDGLGSATYGIGVLVDLDGDDRYTGQARCAGFGAAGVGVFVDAAGADRYELGARSAGVGFAGHGLFVDVAGGDVLAAGEHSCGTGLPGGVGLLVDGSGDDVHRLAGADHPVSEGGAVPVSLGFGAGAGLGDTLAGGIGVAIDLAGNDVRTAAGLAVGVGIRGGCGIFRDAGGDDRYELGDVAAGAAYASGIGICLDDAGDDEWRAGRFSAGVAADLGIGWFSDALGADRVEVKAPALGTALGGALAASRDGGGQDVRRVLGTNAGWQLRLGAAAARHAVGVFVDLGGDADDYALEIAPDFADGESRVLESGTEAARERHALVDRGT